MEPEVVAFLKRVGLTIFLTFCWLAFNVTIGLRFDLAFVDGTVSLGNVLFYIWMVISFIVLLMYLLKLWSKTEKW